MSRPYLVTLKPQINPQSLAGLLYIVLLTSFALGTISCAKSGSTKVAAPAATPLAQNSPVEPMVPRKIFATGEAVPGGYFGYKVFRSWLSDHVPQKDSKQSVAGGFLSVDLAIVNTDRKERAVAAMKLVDETGKEYSPSTKSANVEGSLEQIGKVSPNQSKRAIALFEVPKGHEYKLKIPGFSSSDEVVITLSPGAAPPSP